jgi:RND family efflux transporter MFP subunit
MIGLGLACAGLISSGCGKAPEATAPPPPMVTVETPVQQDVTVFQEYNGNAKATEAVEIRARAEGILRAANFTASTFVNRGDLLFEIERAQYAAGLDKAKADVASSEALLARTESDVGRLEQAVKTNAVSQQEVTRARAERDQAQASLLAAKAALDQAEINLGYTRIHAPISGLISRRLIDPGNLVGRGDATLLANIVKVDPIHVYFDVNERLVAQFLAGSGGMKGQQEIPAEERLRVAVTMGGVDYAFDGVIDYVAPSADADTGTIQVRAVVDNAERVLLPGFFVRISVPAREIPGGLLVPETALSTDLGGRYLMFVDDQNVAQKRYVEPGSLQDGNLRVILNGLEPGERYIIKGLQRARPGMPVTVTGG